jgi:hypothetical protein
VLPSVVVDVGDLTDVAVNLESLRQKSAMAFEFRLHRDGKWIRHVEGESSVDEVDPEEREGTSLVMRKALPGPEEGAFQVLRKVRS